MAGEGLEATPDAPQRVGHHFVRKQGEQDVTGSQEGVVPGDVFPLPFGRFVFGWTGSSRGRRERLFSVAELRAREAPWKLSSAACSDPAWRHLPPSSRMVRFFSGLGPGSRPPLLPASELPRVPPGGLPAAGREKLWHRQGCSCGTPTEDLNRGL